MTNTVPGTEALRSASQILDRQLSAGRQVKGALHLPDDIDGSALAWDSSHPDVISPQGRVRRPGAESLPVEVTLTVGADGARQDQIVSVPPLPEPEPLFGYLLVHFVESREDGGEQIYFSLSDGDDPLRWRRMNQGRPVLTSGQGTGALRDPHIVRSPEGDRFFIVATDLHVHTTDWADAVRDGSRHIEIWRSDDLLDWGEQRHVRVSGEAAGMTWAPEAIWDDAAQAYFVHWTSCLYETSDRTHVPQSKILGAYTRDFWHFTKPHVWMDPDLDPSLSGGGLLDATIAKTAGGYVRFVKGVVEGVTDEQGQPLGDIFAERAPALGTPARQWERIGSGLTFRATGGHHPYEGPLIFPCNTGDEWLLFADHFGADFHGYVPFTNADPATDRWRRVPAEDTDIPPNTKHGAVLPLRVSEWERLAASPLMR
ncbi:glycoside hydrolase family 43 protein [Nonomuraea sp. NPDC026600]|uniref:glycoside hydrolase family 43 protein n=1 Tax=Nonomuraea sp. NPDC026600 TaxID=3155363 RepID=UPI0033CC3214